MPLIYGTPQPQPKNDPVEMQTTEKDAVQAHTDDEAQED